MFAAIFSNIQFLGVEKPKAANSLYKAQITFVFTWFMFV